MNYFDFFFENNSLIWELVVSIGTTDVKMRLLKSIIIFIFSSIFCLISCGQTPTKFSIIDDLSNGDTLTLFAEYAECGEWGGHIEKVFVIKKEQGFLAAFYADSISCPMEKVSRKIKEEKSKALSTLDKNIIADYIDKVLIASKTKELAKFNALYYFRLITKDKKYEYLNWKMDWKEFQNMRTKIFGP